MDKTTTVLLALLALVWVVFVLGGAGMVEVTVLFVLSLAILVQWLIRRRRTS